MADQATSSYQFAHVTPNDHGGLIYIAAFLAFVYSTLTFITRCAIKWHIFGFDDWATCAAQVVSMVQFALLVASLSAGLGRNFNLLSEKQYLRMASLQYGNQIALYLALGLSKCAAVMLIQRLFTRDMKKFWMICSIVTTLMVMWTIFAAFMVSVGCSPSSIAPSTEADTCPGLFMRYEVVAITDALTDVFIILVPAYLISQLQMSAKLKLQVVAVFAFRLPLLPLTFLSLSSWNRSLHSSNPGVERTPAILFQQSELCFSLIAGTIPCLKSFIRSFDTGSGVKVGYTSNGYGSSGYGNSSENRGESFRLKPLTMNISALRSRNEDNGGVKVSRFFKSGHSHGRGRANSLTKVTTFPYSAERPKEEDTASHGSQELFIRRDIQWEVRSENIL